MFAGQLRHLITIETYSEVEDSTGQPIRTYTPFAFNVWARVSPLRGNEFDRADEKFAVATTEIEMRYMPGIVENMRVLHENIYYDILNVKNIDLRNIGLVLTCRSGYTDEA